MIFLHEKLTLRQSYHTHSIQTFENLLTQTVSIHALSTTNNAISRQKHDTMSLQFHVLLLLLFHHVLIIFIFLRFYQNIHFSRSTQIHHRRLFLFLLFLKILLLAEKNNSSEFFF